MVSFNCLNESKCTSEAMCHRKIIDDDDIGEHPTNLRIVIGDGTLPLAYASGAIFVNPDLLCTCLLVQLIKYERELAQ